MNGVSRIVVALAILSFGCDGGPTGTISSTKNPSTIPIAAITHDALFVVNGADATVSVINTETNVVAGTIVLKDASFPHHVYLSSDRARLLVAVPGTDLSGGHSGHSGHGGSGGGSEGAILLLNATTGETIVSRRLPAMNHNALFSPSGKEVWTAQYDGYVLVLDPTTLATLQSIKVGANPSEVTFSNDGRLAFVADTGSNSVTIIDAVTKNVVRTILVGNTPVGAWQGTNGIAYVDNEIDGTVTAIDTATLNITVTYTLGYVPGMAAFGPDGNLWVADSYNGRVGLWKSDASASVGGAPAGQGAHAVAFRGDGANAYVSNQDVNTVSVIDVATRRPVVTISVGNKPNGMVWRAK